MARVVIGWVLIALVLLAALITILDSADALRTGGTAFQQTQINTTGIFFVVVLIGVAIGAYMTTSGRRP
jgi:H+/gluconate symporter-like permease